MNTICFGSREPKPQKVSNSPKPVNLQTAFKICSKFTKQPDCKGKIYLETGIDPIKSEDCTGEVGALEEIVLQDSGTNMEQKALKDSAGTRPLIIIQLMPSPNNTLKSRSSSLPGKINMRHHLDATYKQGKQMYIADVLSKAAFPMKKVDNAATECEILQNQCEAAARHGLEVINPAETTDLTDKRLAQIKQTIQQDGTVQVLQENEQLQKHQLELQESESDETSLYLETELQHAQDELKKLAEKLHRTQKNHTALQQVNQDLENKLHRMAQTHQEEKKNLSHEVITLCNHLIEATSTIDKLTENNLPSEIQERARIYTEKSGCGIPGTACHPSFFNTQAKFLENPEPTNLSGAPLPVSLPRQVIHSHLKNTNKPDQGFPCKSNLYQSDKALCSPAEQRRGRRQVKDKHFFQTPRFTDSFTETEGFSKIVTSDTLPNYAASVPISSIYPSCTMTAEKKGITQAKTILSPTQQVGLRDDIYERNCNTSEEQGNKYSFIQARPLQQLIDVAHGYQDGTQHYSATLPIDFSDSPHLSWMSIQHVRVPKLYSDQGTLHDLEKNRMGQCKKVNMHCRNTSSYRISEKISSNSHTKQQLGSSLMKKTTNQVNQFFTREGNFSDGEDTSQSNITEAAFGTMNCQPCSEIDCKKQESLSIPWQKDTEDDPKTLPREKNTNQMYTKSANNVVNIKKIDVAPNTSVKSLRQYPIKLLVVHNVPLDDVVSNSKQEKSTKISGLYRKDSLTKAQLYGNLLN
ncbi:brain-enriched guanylate kinase-associated protein-like [Carcharodon carcharias]|uniref:brain-enriched guanylate kinase-associated protein-like n=1 Tax=Carcharodon carcharias TaxID=13397 RepID=UPI001B7E83C6|nr:brain-enriched guanylate kinase-associated protein-like [Carcharodon carcharias]